jgi:hypothetical protein
MRGRVKRIEKLEKFRRLAPAEHARVEQILLEAVFDLVEPALGQIEQLIGWCGAAENGRALTRAEMEARRKLGECVLRRCEWRQIPPPKRLMRRWHEPLAFAASAVQRAQCFALDRDLIVIAEEDTDVSADWADALARLEAESNGLLRIWQFGKAYCDRTPPSNLESESLRRPRWWSTYFTAHAEPGRNTREGATAAQDDPTLSTTSDLGEKECSPNPALCRKEV